jgi:hypothetical protein
MLRLEEKTS